jgi:hypothetical protein
MTRAIWICLLASFAAVIASTPAAAQQQKPSILFILADNVGYGDIGTYGAASCAGLLRRWPGQKEHRGQARH